MTINVDNKPNKQWVQIIMSANSLDLYGNFHSEKALQRLADELDNEYVTYHPQFKALMYIGPLTEFRKTRNKILAAMGR